MSAIARIRIAVIDQHPLFREGVSHSLKSDPEIEVIAEGESAGDALRIATEHLPDVLLLTRGIPGGGIAASRSIAASCPVAKVIMLTVSEESDNVMEALAASVRGYVLRNISGPDLVHVVRLIAEGETYVSPGLTAPLMAKMSPASRNAGTNKDMAIEEKLTFREDQVMSLASTGLTNKEIARKLALSEKTVKHYMTAVLQKLHARNRIEAVIALQKKNGQKSL